MLIDTHCHLNFSRFEKHVEEIILRAKHAGVECMVVPGTDVGTSKKAVAIAQNYEGIYAAVGIHPHHVFKFLSSSAMQFLSHESEKIAFASELAEIEKMMVNPKVVAIGEVGLDKHVYEKTVYNIPKVHPPSPKASEGQGKVYQVDEEFINLQKEIFIKQMELAFKYKKALIIHNREAKKDTLEILNKLFCHSRESGNPDLGLRRDDIRAVFHCCEPDLELLDFAKSHKMYIGVDGDVTFSKEKQEFIKKVPLEMLVLETDSPYLLPEPLKSQKLYPNEPKNVAIIAEFIANLKFTPINQLIDVTTENAKRLFSIG